MRPAEKARSLPNARAAPHGYLRPLEETRADSALGSGEALRHARRDETTLERFSACEAFDAAYVWPSAKFKARLDDARGVLEATAKAAGDAFLIERFAEIEAGGDARDRGAAAIRSFCPRPPAPTRRPAAREEAQRRFAFVHPR